MVADIHEAYNKGANQGQVGTALKLAGSHLAKDMFNQVWMGDISKAMGMFSDSPADSNSTARVVGNIASSVAVPAAIAQGKAFTDPNQHDTIDPNSISGSVVNQIINRIPGQSNNLPVRYSVYGNPLLTGQNIIGTHNWLTGGNRVPQTKDPAELELDRLNNLIPNALITPVLKSIKLDDGSTKSLSSDEFEKYQQLAGRAIVETVRNEMTTPAWQKMSDQQRVLEVRSIQTDMKRAARESLFNQ
jgi:hypothetical protein